MRTLALAVLCIGLVAHADEPLRVVDGDTVKVGAITYRLLGYDTPETYYAQCAYERDLGNQATAYLAGLLAVRPYRIEDTGRIDRYGRHLARLLIDDQDVAEIMIGTGMARAYDGRRRREPWC